MYKFTHYNSYIYLHQRNIYKVTKKYTNTIGCTLANTNIKLLILADVCSSSQTSTALEVKDSRKTNVVHEVTSDLMLLFPQLSTGFVWLQSLTTRDCKQADNGVVVCRARHWWSSIMLTQSLH